MRKILILLMLFLLSVTAAGCPARPAPAPAPAPDPRPLVVPETSKVGFSAVDLNRAPDLIKNIALEIAKRETATWVRVNGTNYVLVSVGEQAKGNKAEITEVIQRVPAQDFIWIDVKARYVKDEGNPPNPVTVITLNLPEDRAVNGVGFEIIRTAEAPAPTPTPAPAPAPAPAPRAPAAPAPKPAPAPPAPRPAPAPAPRPAPAPAPAPEQRAPEPPRQEQPAPAGAEQRTMQP